VAAPVDRVRRAANWVWASIGIVLLTAIVLWVAAQVRVIWLPLVFGGGLIIVLEPLVRLLARRRVPRVVGAVLSLALLVAVLAATGFLVVPTVRAQAAEFGASLPGLYDAVVDWLLTMSDRLGIDLGPVWTSGTIQEWLQNPDNQTAIQGVLGGVGTGAGVVLRGATELVTVLLVAPFIAVYGLIDLPRSGRIALELTPPRFRDEVHFVGLQVGRTLTGFVRGQLLVATFVGVLSSVALLILDVPFWAVIGIAAGVLNLVPFVGPFVGGALAAIVSLLEGDLVKAVLAVIAFTAIQQTDNHLITPIIQRARVRLSPLVILLALLAGGSVAGFLGVLVAVPTVAVLRILAGHLWRTRVLGESWEQAAQAMFEVSVPPDLRAIRRRVPQATRLFDTAEIDELGDGAPAAGPAPGPAGDRGTGPSPRR